MSQQISNIRIGITQGDPNGIGLEVIAGALSNPDILELFTPILFADASILAKVVESLDLADFQFVVVDKFEDIKDGQINVINIGEGESAYTPGKPSAEGGASALKALERADQAIKEGIIDLLVTAPIDKNAIQSDAFKFPGHTEYLEDRYGVKGGQALMILADEGLRVSLVTTHMALKDVPPHITRESVSRAIRNFNLALKMDFGCERPKIAVLSLNPHSGDGGLLGKEETSDIIPAIEDCRNDGILAFGPFAADGFFGSGAYRSFDGVLAMYHDQGLAPFKALASGGGFNFTAGLDIVRTSPAHGTAYDKAGRGEASETSMRQAIYAAIDIARRRDNYLVASENPLKIRPVVPRNGKKQKESEEEATLEEEK